MVYHHKSSFSCFPNEILVEILRDTLPVSSLTGIKRPNREMLIGRWSPLPFTRVCKQWRSIILSSPCLWTTLSLVLVPERHGVAHEVSCAQKALSIWLQYSGSSPLTLKMAFYDFHESTLKEIWGDFSPSLDKFISRCRKFRLATYRLPSILPDKLRQQLEKAEGLEELELQISSCGEKDVWYPQAVRLLTKLRVFSAGQYGFLRCSVLMKSLTSANVTLNVPNRGLRMLRLGLHVTCNTLLMLLAHFSGVETASFSLLTIVDNSEEADAIRANAPILVPYLREMSLHIDFGWYGHESEGSSTIAAVEPFQRVILPSLEDLSIGIKSVFTNHLLLDAIVRGLATSLGSSKAQVTTLRLFRDDWCDGYRHLFPAMPSLTTMKIVVEDYTNFRKLLDALQGKSKNGSAGETSSRKHPAMNCPNLETLDLGILNSECKNPMTVVHNLTEFVHRRWNVSSLKSGPPAIRGLELSNPILGDTKHAEVHNNGESKGPEQRHATTQKLRQLMVRESREYECLGKVMLENAEFKGMVDAGFPFVWNAR